MSNTRTFRRRFEANLARLRGLPLRRGRRTAGTVVRHWKLPKLAASRALRRHSPFYRPQPPRRRT